MYKPRLCNIKQGPNGYGFHLHGEKGKMGQKIRKVEDDSPAQHANLKEGDKIIEVNGKNVENESHQQVVARIKEKSGETNLLVVDKETEQYFQDKNIPITAELLDNGVTPDQPPTDSKSENKDELRPRLCKLTRSEGGYGFNLHSEKGKVGRFIRSIDDGGAAAVAGLKPGDRIIEINGKNVENDKHSDVVLAIKDSGDSVEILVVDDKADQFFKSCNVTPTTEHVSGSLPTHTPAASNPVSASNGQSKVTSSSSNGAVTQDILTMDINMLKERARGSKKKAPTSNWNNRQAMFNNL